MKTTRKRYSADFNAKVALEAIGVDLTLEELGTKHGIHHTMIAAWKPKAIDDMASTFAGASEAARASGDAEIGKLATSINSVEHRAGRLSGRCDASDAAAGPVLSRLVADFLSFEHP